MSNENKEPVEIERKFLINNLPPAPALAVYDVTSAYISLDPEIRIREMNLRVEPNDPCTNLPHIPTRFKMTVKSPGTLTRFESETPIKEKFFNEMIEFTGKEPIKKVHYHYADGDRTIEVSIVDPGKPSSFLYAEVEFNSEEEAAAYVWPYPEILIEEVTDNPWYKMKNYWFRTRLNPHKHSTR